MAGTALFFLLWLLMAIPYVIVVAWPLLLALAAVYGAIFGGAIVWGNRAARRERDR